MFIKPFTRFCSIFILLSGLISCSKDKKAVPDAFRAGGISSQNADRSFQMGKDIQKLEVGSQLTIESLKNVDFTREPIHFTISSQCTDMSTKKMFNKEFHQQNSAVFNVLYLIPEEILTLNQTSQVFCDFTLVAENSFSSKSTAQLKNVEIKGLLTFNNSTPDFIKDNMAVYQDSYGSVLALYGEEANVSISCSDFSSRLSSRTQLITLQNMVEMGLSTQTATTNKQICRLYIQSNNQISLTAPFTLYLPTQRPVVSAEIPQVENLFEAQFERIVYRFKIFNPNSFPLKIKMKKSSATDYYFQPLFQISRYNTGLGAMRIRKMIWQSESEITSLENDNLEFEVPDQGEFVLNGIAAIGLDCRLKNKDKMSIYIGEAVGFDFQSQLSVEHSPGHEEPLNFKIPESSTRFQSPMTGLTIWSLQQKKGQLQSGSDETNMPLLTEEQLLSNITGANKTYCREF